MVEVNNAQLYVLVNAQDRITQTQANSVGYRAPSYGLFKTSLTPEYWYGIPRNVTADGLGMDVDRMISQRVDKQNNREGWLAFNRTQGARMSAMEHLVPEQMVSTDEAPANGVSAVKAIQLAAAEGQKIYTITQANLSIAMQQLQLSSEIKTDIRNAVNAGMEVTAHRQPVNFFGRPSVGYILLDPNTGAGAYRIGGGENGNETFLAGAAIFALGAVGAIGVFSGVLISPLLVAFALALGQYLIILELATNPNLNVSSLKDQLIVLIGMVLLPIGVLGSVGAVVSAIVTAMLAVWGLL